MKIIEYLNKNKDSVSFKGGNMVNLMLSNGKNLSEIVFTNMDSDKNAKLLIHYDRRDISLKGTFDIITANKALMIVLWQNFGDFWLYYSKEAAPVEFKYKPDEDI